jgi:hypothetical protein
MNKYLTLLFGGAVAAVLMSASYDNPGGKAGYTGSTGEQTCAKSGCHDSYTLNSGTGSVTISCPTMPTWEYTPGTSYQISVTVAKSGNTLFALGFEALQSSGANGGTLTAGTGTHTANATVSGNSRKNIVQSTDGGASSNTHTFTFTWVAPTTNIGNVTFYTSGMCCNNNGNEVGDYVYSKSQVVTPVAASVEEATTEALNMIAYPNPTSEMMNLDYTLPESGKVKASVFSINGQHVMDIFEANQAAGFIHRTFDASSLASGLYVINLSVNGKNLEAKMIEKK